jgi:phage-related protein
MVFGDLFNKIKSSVSNVFSGIKDTASNIYNKLKGPIQSAITFAKPVADLAKPYIEQLAKPYVEPVLNKAIPIVEKVKNYFQA